MNTLAAAASFHPPLQSVHHPEPTDITSSSSVGRLLEFAGQASTYLQIAPYSMAERKPFRRLVYLLTMPDRSLMSYVESQTQGHLDRELSSVLPLVRNYHQLQIGAASQADSIAMIEDLRKGTLR